MRRARPRAAVAIAAVAALLALAGCGPGGGETGGGARVRTIEIDVHYSAFSTSAIAVHAGETVRFKIRNRDPIAHELIVGDQSVQDYHEHGTEAHHAGRPGEVSVVPGSTAETVYTFISRGAVLFGCHLPGHWAYGMNGTITVA